MSLQTLFLGNSIPKLTRQRKIDIGLVPSDDVDEAVEISSRIPFTQISLFFSSHWIRIAIKSAFSYSENSQNQVTIYLNSASGVN